MDLFTIILIVGGCIGVIAFLFLILLCSSKCNQKGLNTNVEQNWGRPESGRNGRPSVRIENETRKGQPVMPIKAAIRKHIYPNCRTSADAVKISVQRNKTDPTEVNTVFQAQSSQFHLETINGEEVIRHNKKPIYEKDVIRLHSPIRK